MGNSFSSLSSREVEDANPQNRELQDNGFIQLRSTHDVSVADAHIQKADQFVSDLQEAINAVTSTSNKGRYTEIHVLFLCWREDSLGVKREITDLSNVLSRMYRFETHHYEIHGEKPGRDTQTRVGRFLDEHDARDHLLILYYAGHAMPGRQGSEPPIWTESIQPGAPTMAAGGIQAVFEEADADALLLYDSCHSAHPAINSSGHGVTEVIAAAGFELQAPTVGRDSFTHALIQALTQACRGPPFSATKLHEMALRWLKCRTRDYLRDQHGDIWTDPSGRPALQRTPTSTPVHCFLTEERPHRGIMLAPLPVKPTESMDSKGSISSSNTSTLPPNSQTSSEIHASSTTELSDDLKSGTTNILLSVRLENDYFQDDNTENVWAWREWIRNMPPEANAVKVEAIYRSTSTLILLSLPVAFWDALPNNPAYSFVGFVTSDNKASAFQFEDLIDATLKEAETPRLPPNSTLDSGYIGNASGETEYLSTRLATIDTSPKGGRTNSEFEDISGTGALIIPSPTVESEERDLKAGIPKKRTSVDSSSAHTTQKLEDLAETSADVNAAAPNIQTDTALPLVDPEQVKTDWTADDLLRAAETGTSHSAGAVSVWNPKTIFLYDLESIITSLKSLNRLGYQVNLIRLGQRYENTLRRCAVLIGSHQVIIQILANQNPSSISSTHCLSSLAASPLFNNELSNSREHKEASFLRDEMERYVQTANLYVSVLKSREL